VNIDRLAIAILILAGCQHWLLADETVVWNESMKVVHFETLQHSLLDKLRSQSVTGTVVIRVGLDTSGGVSSVIAISGPKDLGERKPMMPGMFWRGCVEKHDIDQISRRGQGSRKAAKAGHTTKG